MKTSGYVCPGKLQILIYFGALQQVIRQLMKIHPEFSEQEVLDMAQAIIKEHG